MGPPPALASAHPRVRFMYPCAWAPRPPSLLHTCACSSCAGAVAPQAKVPDVQVRQREGDGVSVRVDVVKYDRVAATCGEPELGASMYEQDFDDALAQRRLRAQGGGATAADASMSSNALPFKAGSGGVRERSLVGAFLEDQSGSYDSDGGADAASDGGGGALQRAWAAGSGFGASSFVKPHVSVMVGSKAGGGGKRGKGRASARRASR
eukprot:224337-Chlamydomonas_euryale.AAC.3